MIVLYILIGLTILGTCIETNILRDRIKKLEELEEENAKTRIYFKIQRMNDD